ncbi:MAG: OmpA family protein [Elioraea sp.]|nr:OmpA family protein [Elioraea sp.]MDW8444841.1 flagellar motor protein MotB [Acetobacteraceae bacterium]
MSKGKGKGKDKDAAPIVIRREEGEGHGHHGGAWKVAYADFVTAMMAFFLLMWLLNATTEEQRLGIANYFAEANIFGMGGSGTGRPFRGSDMTHDDSLVGRAGTPTVPQVPRSFPPDQVDVPDEGEPHQAEFAEGGAFAKPFADGGRFADPRTRGQGGDEATEGEAERARLEREQAAEAEARALEAAAAAIRAEISADPALAALARHLAVDVTPEGLRLQLLDSENRAMFALGSAQPNEAARALLVKIAPILARLDKPVTIAGHTDAAPFRPGSAQSNWDLSAERANAARRLLQEGGLPERLVQSVSGRADREPLLPADPRAPANRRIAIFVQRTTPAGAAAAGAAVN